MSKLTGSTSEASTHFNLRAIEYEWSCSQSALVQLNLQEAPELETFEIGTDSGENVKLKIPGALAEDTYLNEKILPGMLVQYSLPAWYSEAMRQGSPFRLGLLISASQDQCVVHPMPLEVCHDYVSKPLSEHQRCEASEITLPLNLINNAGMPQIQLSETLPFSIYSALTVPLPFQQIQVLVDHAPITQEQQSTIFEEVLFTKASESESSINEVASSADLVVSRVSLLVDGNMGVPILIPAMQCQSE
eukprot:TRINITY_DN10502_c0_g2_i1.p1 TRINITY_DN10502_c0_g2~~TRINITY_DN10502_c0_g2_i1.p1  ORF type:complete len:268 (-),score=36.36 TRINITY_DN10502_c0_g2_i1:26-766(-)